ncbi:MGMT family protein [Aeoliella sp. ICT_H6.2]|uniref:methylated-DNA--[protein]-cysteine S-methyltransferase n=1 Tax=Aeoliella straminimaris TaxID=2954799 RepID=A0A9X2FCP5_9BACT|nr:MGMT family protein [Aeoliella straminimaris]MCO6046550.1 MGMT family protein [Aeoliella straminimaris]
MPATLAKSAASPPAKSESVCFESNLGWMAVAYNDQKLGRILFGHPQFASLAKALKPFELEPARQLSDCPRWVNDLCDRLQRLADGEPQTFDSVPVSTSHLTPFATRVIGECRKLPWGRVVTYTELARLAGRPAAARAVGNVMANNRYPLVVPCHRVVGTSGHLGGFSAPGGLNTKRRLLEMEGAL